MDLRAYYQKIRDIEAEIVEEFPVVVSVEGPDGGRAGVRTEVTRRIAARPGVYNLAVTKDGTRLLATNKREQSVSVVDLKTGRELARLPTRRSVLHGVVVSPDDRYAFVSVEGVGAEPGTVEIIDLTALKIVASLDVPEEAAGIDFLRTEPAK